MRGTIGRMGPMGRMDEAEQEHDLGLAAGGLDDAQIVSCLLGWLDGFFVEFDVIELEAEGVANGEAAFGFDVDILERDIAQRTLSETNKTAGAAAVFCNKIANGDSVEYGRGFFRRRGSAELLGEPGRAEGVHVEIEDLADAIGLNIFVKD